MFPVLRDIIIKFVASPPPGKPPPATRRECLPVVMVAAMAGVWIFAHKMQCFLGLETTSDLYSEMQQTTTWLLGRMYEDNCFGNILKMHTYFLSPLLGVLTLPFGAVGLFIALGLAVALEIGALVRIQRVLGLPPVVALFFGLAVTVMPLAVHVYQDSIYGFHLELLEPALALWFAYYLLRRQWLGSITLALVLILLKEDAPLLVVTVAAMVLSEDFIRSLGHQRGQRWNLPAASLMLLAVLAVPVLLHFLKVQQGGGAATNLARLHPEGSPEISSNGALFSFAVNHLGTWMKSRTVTEWLGLALPATFGLILLRPHFLVAGVLTTAIAWLVQESVLWSPRFVQSLAFFQLTGCLAFASVYQLCRDSWVRSRRSRVVTGGVILLVGFGGLYGVLKQWQAVPRTTEVYRLRPTLVINRADRMRADRLYDKYRRESRQSEPVIASPYLFRYAHDRNLLWYNHLKDQPKAEWILWDKKGGTPLSTLVAFLRTDAGSDLSDYELRGQEADRFLLFKRRLGARTQGVWTPGPVVLAGEPDGPIRMNVRLAEKRAGMSEPILSLGPKGDGDLIFVRYLSETQIVLGVENMGHAVHLSQPVEYRPGRTYELEYFSGALLPEKSNGPEDAKLLAERRLYENLERLRWNGQEVLNVLSLQHRSVRSDEIYVGFNQVQAGSAYQVFAGEISDVRRTGNPEMPDQEFGALRMVLELPAKAAGIPEPLVVLGKTGEAALGYVRVLPHGLIKMGTEFWGWGAQESEPVPANSTKPVEVMFSFPGLYPPVGDARWGDVPVAKQIMLRSSLIIKVNGTVVLESGVTAPVPNVSAITFGQNPAGGSLVSWAFTGRLLLVSRLPLSIP